jgi:hypothetical protein
LTSFAWPFCKANEISSSCAMDMPPSKNGENLCGRFECTLATEVRLAFFCGELGFFTIDPAQISTPGKFRPGLHDAIMSGWRTEAACSGWRTNRVWKK